MLSSSLHQACDSSSPREPKILVRLGIYLTDIHMSSMPILQRYQQVLTTYLIGISIGPQSLSYSGIHKCSRPILQEYPQDLKASPLGVRIGSQGLSYRGIHRSSRPILQGYPQVPNSYSIGLGMHRARASRVRSFPVPGISGSVIRTSCNNSNQ